MTVRAVFFDVGETLVDEERWWRRLAEREGLQPHVVWAALGVTIARGEEHNALWGHLGLEKPTRWWTEIPYSLEDLYPDAIGCLTTMRALGFRVGIAGNQTETLEAWAREAALPADVISSSASLGVSKPDPAFFERVVELMECRADEVAYVGDRVDNDVLPARAAGLRAVHVRRGPWGRLQPTPPGVVGIDSLEELPAALDAVVASSGVPRPGVPAPPADRLASERAE
jgi:HAD superfamily hydrolase (TIGR01549 family)